MVSVHFDAVCTPCACGSFALSCALWLPFCVALLLHAFAFAFAFRLYLAAANFLAAVAHAGCGGGGGNSEDWCTLSEKSAVHEILAMAIPSLMQLAKVIPSGSFALFVFVECSLMAVSICIECVAIRLKGRWWVLGCPFDGEVAA